MEPLSIHYLIGLGLGVLLLIMNWARTWGFSTTTTTVTDFVASLHFNSSPTIMM